MEEFDVVVVGSGAAGLTAAVRAADLGLSVLVIEKAQRYGGTSATSGGVIWIPNHDLADTGDSREKALTYIDAVSRGPVRRDRQEAFVDTGPELARYIQKLGIPLLMIPGYPDYYPDAAGANAGRALLATEVDGAALGDHFDSLRDQFPRFKLFNRFTMDLNQAYAMSTRAKGWQKVVASMLWKYATDLSWRRRTKRDRRLTMGSALIGGLRRALIARGVEVRLGTGLERFVTDDRRIAGVEASSRGRRSTIMARHGVVVAAGGFEWNQELRNRYFEMPGSARWSSTPEEGNRGDALVAGEAIGAAVEFMETAWWGPTMQMPIAQAPNVEMTHQAIFDVGRPYCIVVNRNGVRFVDEACSYDRFGQGMIEDQRKTGANLPCWAIYDARHRAKFSMGGFLPMPIMPDRKIPRDLWDRYIYKADSLSALAGKIGMDPGALQATVARFNGFAKNGVDDDFGRGSNDYDRFFGDPAVTPNPCLGVLDQGPFYAVPINLGDLGTKGGLKADADARVLDNDGAPIAGLYAAGNAAGSPFGDCYPGAGSTIGPAMVFGYRAAEHIARAAIASNSRAAA